MRRAIIDLGTNTFNLLIADTQTQQVLFQTKEGVALGLGGINERRIDNPAIDRAMLALKKFKDHCAIYQVQEIHAIGTSALRDAQNASDFVQKVSVELQIQIEIVSGLREAELIYKGVKLTHHFDAPALIMDIGGGSTELIAADQQGPFLARSFDIGVSRLFQLFDFQDPFSTEDIAHIEAYLEFNCGHFFSQNLPDQLIGASGSFETFYELIEKKIFAADGRAIQVDPINFNNMLAYIIGSTQAERDANPHIISIRKRMAPIAAVKTRWVINKAAIQKIYISPYSLKEGVLFDL
ncbi:MAG: hypothetical protein ACKOBN_09865 [Flavobacteriales bacterium]